MYVCVILCSSVTIVEKVKKYLVDECYLYFRSIFFSIDVFKFILIGKSQWMGTTFR